MTFATALEQFIEHLQILNYSKATVEGYSKILKYFGTFLSDLYVKSIYDVTERHIRLYQKSLTEREVRGRPFSIKSQRGYLSAVKSLFRYLHRLGTVKDDPALRIELPRPDRQLPRGILEPAEMKKLLAAPDLNTSVGIRNRAILELFYSSAVRLSELISLQLKDMNLMGCECIVQGKGGKEAIVPFGKSARSALDNWLTFARPRLIREENGYLFVTSRGKRLGGREVRFMVSNYAKDAGIEKPCSPHGLRHSCATHLLKGGADVRHIQRLLRHESLNTTQIYTRVDVSDLKEAQRKFHPREVQYHATE